VLKNILSIVLLLTGLTGLTSCSGGNRTQAIPVPSRSISNPDIHPDAYPLIKKIHRLWERANQRELTEDQRDRILFEMNVDNNRVITKKEAENYHEVRELIFLTSIKDVNFEKIYK